MLLRVACLLVLGIAEAPTMRRLKSSSPHRNDFEGSEPLQKLGYCLASNENDFLRKRNGKVGAMNQI